MAITVNGEKISKKDIEEEFTRLKDDYDRYVREQNSDGGDTQLRQWSEENLVERVLIRQAAEKSSISIPKEEIDKAYKDAADSLKDTPEDKARSEIEVQMKTAKLIEEVQESAKTPTDKDITDFYEENIEEFHAPERVHVSHIVKHLDQGQDRTQAFLAISNISQEIKKGKPFEELAAADSDCPDNAGSLGYFARGEMVQEFEDVVFNMKEGEVSDVFETPFGYHIAKLHERVPAGPVPLEAVKEDVREKLTEDFRQKAVEDFVDELKAKAEIQR